jgi:peptidoglycan/LPS O-acetylase OafA/YrhL
MGDASQSRVEETNVIPSYSVHLDAVRALAALVVFLGHGTSLFLGTTIHEQANQALNPAYAAANSYMPDNYTHLGHQAVIVFFVLSGYFVGGGVLRAVRRRQWSAKYYLLQRLTRLWIVLIPALFLGALIDTAGIYLFSNTGMTYANLWGVGLGSVFNVNRVWFALSSFIGNVFFLQQILVKSFGTNGSLWSISYEFWYYIMFPLLLAGFMPSSRMLRRVCSIAILIAILIFCGKDISIYFLIWIMGVLTYCLPIGITQALVRWITPMMCLLFVAFNLYAVVFPYNIVASDFTTGLFFSVILWLLLHFRQPAHKSLYRFVFTRLSAMSYTLYAVHYPIIIFFSAWLIPKLSDRHFSLYSVGYLLAAYAAAFSISYLFYRCFEANTERVRRILSVRLGIS